MSLILRSSTDRQRSATGLSTVSPTISEPSIGVVRLQLDHGGVRRGATEKIVVPEVEAARGWRQRVEVAPYRRFVCVSQVNAEAREIRRLHRIGPGVATIERAQAIEPHKSLLS